MFVISSSRIRILFFIFTLTVMLLVGLLVAVGWAQATSTDTVGVRVWPGEPLPSDTVRIIEYETFRWALVPAENGRNLTRAATSYTLKINGVDVTAQADRSNAAGEDFHLVQLVGPTKAQWLDQLSAAVEVVQYIHPFTYVVWGESAEISAIQSNQEFIHWSSHFPAELRQQIDSTRLATATYNLLVYRGADQKTIQTELENLTNQQVELEPINAIWAVGQLETSRSQASRAAQIAGVFSIQTVAADGGNRNEESNQVIARNLDENGFAELGYLDWLSTTGVNGDGVRVAVVDSGTDQSHPDLAGQFVDCEGESCGLTTQSNHGTHTAGIVGATGATGITNTRGFLRGVGVAPGVEMVEQNYLPYFLQPNGVGLLMQESAENGAQISTNSWGTASRPRGYDAATLQADIFVRDGLPNVAGNQPLAYILAFMNGYGGEQSQGAPDEAKNLLTVGSTIMATTSGVGLAQPTGLSNNSAHGPALDGRQIPHIVAPGCHVESTILNNLYGPECGTSMAAPHVAGAAALFFEQYHEQYALYPSPALLKAAMTVHADTLFGLRDADGDPLGHPFDSKQGWGALNLARLLRPDQTTLYLDGPMLLTESGQSWSKRIRAADPTQPIRIMLAWTDAPGHGMGGDTPAWVNDLDLMVSRQGQTYFGNQFGEDGYSLVGESADFQNNTEAVFIEQPNGAYTLEVVAANLGGDGVPQNQFSTDQDFALACVNCELVNVSVSVSKSADTEIATIGGKIEYQISRQVVVTTVVGLDEVLTDTLPAQVKFLTDTVKSNGVDSLTYNPQTHQLVILPMPTRTISISYQVEVMATFTQPVTATNTVVIALNQFGEPIPGNNSASASTLLIRDFRTYLPIVPRE